jgi:hypothetical protein
MSRILAIDPGTRESGWVIIDVASRRPLHFGKDPNADVLDLVTSPHRPTYDSAVIEMVASYGMSVGADVFETCVWIGRFAQALNHAHAIEASLVTRRPVKLHHCHSAKANDANIRQALVDRFAPGQPNHGKGTKAAPGWFYGFRADIWQAFALAVYAADIAEEVAA